MGPPTKRNKLESSSKGKQRAEESESEDEWANERTEPLEQDDESSGEDESDDGIAQFEDDDEELFEESEEDDPEIALGKQLSSIPFGSLLKAKKKLSKSAALEAAQEAEDRAAEEQEGAGYIPKSRTGREEGRVKGGVGLPGQSRRANGSLRKADRSSKHAPMEMSSKRAVGRSRVIVETRADKSRDPRFDSLSGAFKPDLFRTSYAFLAEAQQAELATLKKTAAAARKNMVLPQEDKDNIEAALTRMESREVARRTKEREGDALRDWKKKETLKRTDGKKEFYLKKGEQKQVILAAKFETLSKDKKLLRKTVEKKRRKTGQQEKKLMPTKRKRE